tara:strand:- start:201 stop:707 length:507 start_codon:yes stop_codon:yes gene_type:complete
VILEVDRKYLEISDLNNLNAQNKPNKDCNVSKIEPPNFQLNKFLYKQIGKKYNWKDRLIWEDKDWIKYTSNLKVNTFLLKEKDEIVGYFEQILDSEQKECEIAYFGILENYFGKKYGSYLLSEAIKISLRLNKRVWVHTCSLDHKHALNNYLSRGMKIFKSEKIKIKN